MTDRSRILVVDDVEENLVALEALLRRETARKKLETRRRCVSFTAPPGGSCYQL